MSTYEHRSSGVCFVVTSTSDAFYASESPHNIPFPPAARWDDPLQRILALNFGALSFLSLAFGCNVLRYRTLNDTVCAGSLFVLYQTSEKSGIFYSIFLLTFAAAGWFWCVDDHFANT